MRPCDVSSSPGWASSHPSATIPRKFWRACARPNRASRAPINMPNSASAARCTARPRSIRPNRSIAVPCASSAAAPPGTTSPWNRRSAIPASRKRTSPTSAPASSWARAARPPRDHRCRRHRPHERTQAGRPVRGAQGDVVDRLGDARHLVQDQGRELFDLVGLRDLQPLHRQRRRDDPMGQAGHGLRRRLRGTRLDAVRAVRRHGRDVVEIQRHAAESLARL